MYTEIDVGSIIRNIRIEKNMLLKEVAEKSGISSSMLSQIEKGNANPSLNTIKEIASVLQVPIYKFFIDKDTKENIKINKKDDRKMMTMGDMRYELISPEKDTKLEMMEMIFHKKNAISSVKQRSHNGEEVAILTSGKVKIQINQHEAVLNVGDAVHIPSLTPHKWINIYDGESRVIFVVTPPEF